MRSSKGLKLNQSEIKAVLHQIAEECAEELGVSLPVLVYELDRKTSGNLARLVLNENKKPVRLEIDISHDVFLDLVLAVVHELRHVYQCEYETCLLNDYALLEQSQTNEYNLQEAEVDANAYAALFCEKHFGMKPLFQGYSREVRRAIENRKKILKDDF